MAKSTQGGKKKERLIPGTKVTHRREEGTIRHRSRFTGQKNSGTLIGEMGKEIPRVGSKCVGDWPVPPKESARRSYTTAEGFCSRRKPPKKRRL